MMSAPHGLRATQEMPSPENGTVGDQRCSGVTAANTAVSDVADGAQ
jgi:hypothetical protein